MGAKYISLGIDGVISDPNDIIDRLFANCLLSDANQSVLCNGYVASLQDVVANTQQSPSKMVEAVEAMFTQLFSGYFDNVRFTISTSDKELNNKMHGIALNISGTVTYDSIDYDIARTLYNTDRITYKLLEE